VGKEENIMVRRTFALLAAVASLFASAIDLDEDGSLKLTGFYNLTAGRILTGKDSEYNLQHWQYQKWNCPCSIQNWEYVGVYEKKNGWETAPESLVGVQIKKTFSDTLSATAQFVSRADNTNYRPYTPTVDWAYLSWKPNADSGWTFQGGRKRIPLYYYSDYLYIGYAYPWVRPAPDVYGWPIYTYNGVNAIYETELGQTGWNLTANGWYGNYTQRSDAYDTQIYANNFFYPPPPGDVNESWKDIWGSYASVSNGIFEVRGMVMVYHDSTWQNVGGADTYYVNKVHTRIVGLSGNVDYKNWLVRTEFDRFEQNPTSPARFVYNYLLAGVGYRVGDFTPMYTFSRYATEPNNFPQSVEARNTSYFSVRWDFHKNMAFKVQYDISKDKSQYPFPFWGDSNLLSMSLQGIF
jgi:hypothetical protein